MNKKDRIGQYRKCGTAREYYHAYMPQPLPPFPVLDMPKLYPLLDKANVVIGRLDGVGRLLPEPDLFLYFYVRKEAVLSSQIEGTQSSLSDLLLYENDKVPGVPEHDVKEVSHYVAAMEYGLQRLSDDGFPLSLRLIREIHAILLQGGLGSYSQPGSFRRSQNWIGGTRPGNAKYVPPPSEEVMSLMGDLEKFWHDDRQHLPTLVKAALIHVQFETIHPFLDGNGRLGRLLITFLLCIDGLLDKPLLYLSLFFKTHRQQYYDHLQSVRETGDWEAWVQFFLEGVIDTTNQAINVTQEILALFKQDRTKIETLRQSAPSALQVHHYLQQHCVTDIARVVKQCQLSPPTVTKALSHLVDLGIAEEITGKGRNRTYVYRRYLEILARGVGANQ